MINRPLLATAPPLEILMPMRFVRNERPIYRNFMPLA